MHPSISRSYIVPAIFLNPVLFLMSVNTILSRLLPPIVIDAVIQPPPYSTFGPSAEHPHLDIHASESLCWGYTFVMVCAQIVAFGRVSERREEGRKKARAKRERSRSTRTRKMAGSKITENGDAGVVNGFSERGHRMPEREEYSSCAESDQHTERSDESYETVESETIH